VKWGTVIPIGDAPGLLLQKLSECKQRRVLKYIRCTLNTKTLVATLTETRDQYVEGLP
jgi:hypothetical protein